jgi:hypothetical protein
MRKSVDDAGYDGLTSSERLKRQRGGTMREMFARNWGYPVGSPESKVTDTMKWGTGVGGDEGLAATLTGSAEVKGDATVTVKVEAGSELLRAYEGAKTALHLMGQLNTNGPRSLGHSSPDASAPVEGGRSTPGNSGASGSW